jgi:hypothetical protein
LAQVDMPNSELSTVSFSCARCIRSCAGHVSTGKSSHWRSLKKRPNHICASCRSKNCVGGQTHTPDWEKLAPASGSSTYTRSPREFCEFKAKQNLSRLVADYICHRSDHTGLSQQSS